MIKNYKPFMKIVMDVGVFSRDSDPRDQEMFIVE